MYGEAGDLFLEVQSGELALVVVLGAVFVELKAHHLKIADCAQHAVGLNADMTVPAQTGGLHHLNFSACKDGAVAVLHLPAKQCGEHACAENRRRRYG